MPRLTPRAYRTLRRPLVRYILHFPWSASPSTRILDSYLSVCGRSCDLKTPAEKLHASASNLSKPPSALNAIRPAYPALFGYSQSQVTPSPAGLSRSPKHSPIVFHPVPGLDRSAQFHNEVSKLVIHTMRHETDQVPANVTLRPLPVHTFDLWRHWQ